MTKKRATLLPHEKKRARLPFRSEIETVDLPSTLRFFIFFFSSPHFTSLHFTTPLPSTLLYSPLDITTTCTTYRYRIVLSHPTRLPARLLGLSGLRCHCHPPVLPRIRLDPKEDNGHPSSNT